MLLHQALYARLLIFPINNLKIRHLNKKMPALSAFHLPSFKIDSRIMSNLSHSQLIFKIISKREKLVVAGKKLKAN